MVYKVLSNKDTYGRRARVVIVCVLLATNSLATSWRFRFVAVTPGVHDHVASYHTSNASLSWFRDALW